MPSVLFVCLGNICRSPMAEGLLRRELARRGWSGWTVDSAGTAGHHEGEDMDPRTAAVLRRGGAHYAHRARRVTDDDPVRFDLMLAMDGSNLQALRRRFPELSGARLQLMLEPVGGADVPDPWYGGPEGFEEVQGLLQRALDAWLDRWEATPPGG